VPNLINAILLQDRVRTGKDRLVFLCMYFELMSFDLVTIFHQANCLVTPASSFLFAVGLSFS